MLIINYHGQDNTNRGKIQLMQWGIFGVSAVNCGNLEEKSPLPDD
jgi:hypothetical protein